MRQFSTVELTQQIGAVTHAASREPVAITHHRKPRFVLMSVEDYERLRAQGRPRRVYGVGETPTELADMLATELERRLDKKTLIMTTDRFKDGHIVEYPYLWKWQEDLGRDEDEKNRPACLVMVVKDELRNLTHLVILPISGTPPKSDQIALEIPSLELKRAGLADVKRGWITVSEYNYDILERSWDFPVNSPPIGRFSRPFLRQIEQAFLPTLRSNKGRVDRTL